MTSFSESVSLQPSIVSLHRVSPVRLQLGSASVISVQVLGHPSPRVSWYIGKNRVQPTSPNFRAEADGQGRRHNLRIAKVTRELGEGVTIEATNDVGRDHQSIDIAICQDDQAEDVPKRTSSALASSNGAFEHISGFDGQLPVAGRSSYSFTDDIFDELFSPGIPPLLLVQSKETIFPDDASREIFCPATEEGSIPDPMTSNAQEENLKTKTTVVKSGRSNTKAVRGALKGQPPVKDAAQDIWKLHGVALDPVYRDLLRDAVPTEDDLDDLVSQNENWEPNRKSNSKVKSETETSEPNEKNTVQQPSLLSEVDATTNKKKSSRLTKLKDRIKRIKMRSGKKQNNDGMDNNSPSVDQHPTSANDALDSQIISKQNETTDGKTSSNKRTSRKKKTPMSAENGGTAEFIVQDLAEADNSNISRISTDRQRVNLRHENSTGYLTKDGSVEYQNELAGSGDLSPAGYRGSVDSENTIKYRTLQSREFDSNNSSNETATTDANRKENSTDPIEGKSPSTATSRQIEFQSRGFPKIQLILKEGPGSREDLEASDNNEIFDETRINLTCSSPPADEIERCRHRLSSNLSQEKTSSSSGRLQQRRSDSDSKTDSVAQSSHGRTTFSSGDDADRDSRVVSPPRPPPAESGVNNDVGSSRKGPVETQQSHGGWVVARRTRADPTPRSRSCHRASTAERRSWIENARSVEIQVPRRSRSTSRTRWRSLNKEWDLVTVTTTTEETRTLTIAAATAAAHTKAAVATAKQSVASENEDRSRSTTTTNAHTTTPTTAPTAAPTTAPTTATEAADTTVVEPREAALKPVRKSPKISGNAISMDSSQDSTTSDRPERTTYRATLSSLERSNSSVDSSSTDAGEYVLRSCPVAGVDKISNDLATPPREQTLNNSNHTQPRGTTPRRSRKEHSFDSSCNDDPSKTFDPCNRQALKSFSFDFIQPSELETNRTWESDRDAAAACEARVEAEMSTANRSESVSMEVKGAAKNREVLSEPCTDTESVELRVGTNEKKPETFELRFKVSDVNPDTKMMETSHDVNCEVKEVNRDTHFVEVRHDVNYDEKSAESKRKVDELAKKRRSAFQVNHEANGIDASVELDETKSSEVGHEINRVVLDRKQPEGKNLAEFSSTEVTELNEAVNKLNAEMIALNTDKTRINSNLSVESSVDTMTLDNVNELSSRFRHSILVTSRNDSLGWTDESDSFGSRGQTEDVPLDLEVPERNAEDVRLRPERIELNDEVAHLNRAMTRLSAEMLELNSGNPQDGFASLPSANHETYEVNIALHKRRAHNNSTADGYSMDASSGSSAIETTEPPLLAPEEKTLHEAYVSYHVSDIRETSNIASDYENYRRMDGQTRVSSAKGVSDSESHESTLAEEAQSTDDSVFERGEDDTRTGLVEIWTDSEDRLSPEESATPKFMSEFTYKVRIADDADAAESLTQRVTSDVTRIQQSDDVITTLESMTPVVTSDVTRTQQRDDVITILESMTPEVISSVTRTQESDDTITTLESMTPEVMSGVSEDNDDADTMESWTFDVTSEVNAAVTDAVSSATARKLDADKDTKISRATAVESSRGINQLLMRPGDVLSFSETLTLDNLSAVDRRPDSRLSLEAASFEGTDEDSYAIVDDNWKDHSGLFQRTGVDDGLRTEEMDTCEEDETSMTVEDLLEYKQMEEAGSLVEATKSKAVDPDDGGNSSGSLKENALSAVQVHSSTVVMDTRDVLQDTRVSEITRSLKNTALPAVQANSSTVVMDTRDVPQDTVVSEVTHFGAESLTDSNREGLMRSEKNETKNLETNGHSKFSDVTDDDQMGVHDYVTYIRSVFGARSLSCSVVVDRDPDEENSEDVGALSDSAHLLRATVHRRTTKQHPVAKPVKDAATDMYALMKSSEMGRPSEETKYAADQLESTAETLADQAEHQVALLFDGSSFRFTAPEDAPLERGVRKVSVSSLVLRRPDVRHVTVEERTIDSIATYPTTNASHGATAEETEAKTHRSEFQTEIKRSPPVTRSITLPTPNTSRSRGDRSSTLSNRVTSSAEIMINDYGIENRRPSEVQLRRTGERPNRSSLSEIKLQIEKDYALEARPKRRSLSEIKFKTEKNFQMEGPLLEKPNCTSLSEIKFQREKNYALEGPKMAGPNRTSLSEVNFQKEKNYALEGHRLVKPNHTSLAEIKLQRKQNQLLEDLSLASRDAKSLSEVNVRIEKNYVLEDPSLASSDAKYLSETRFQTKRKHAPEDLHLAEQPKHTSLSEIEIQTQKNYALEGPLLATQPAAVAKHSANKTFRTILTIIGQDSKDETSSIDKEHKTGNLSLSENLVSELNNRQNEVTTLTIPTSITVLLDETDAVDLTNSLIATHDPEASAGEQKSSSSCSIEVDETIRFQEDGRAYIYSESVTWSPSRGRKEDIADNGTYLESLTGTSSDAMKVKIEDGKEPGHEAVADSEEEYDAARSEFNQLNPFFEQSSKTIVDSDRFEEMFVPSETVNAEDLDGEEKAFQQHLEKAEIRYEFESKEIINEMAREDGIRFNEATIATSVESESETERVEDANENSWKEESTDMINGSNEDGRGNNINVTEVFQYNKSEETYDITDEFTTEAINHFDRNTIVASVECDGESESRNADKLSWKEKDTEDMLLGEDNEAHFEQKVDENRDIREDDNRFDQDTFVNSIEAESELEGGKAGTTTWKEIQTEEIEKGRSIDTAEAEYENEFTGEFISDDGRNFDRSPTIETGDTISWKEEDMSRDEEGAVKEYFDITENQQEMETGKHDDMIDDEDESHSDEITAVNSAETNVQLKSGKADTINWEEEENLEVLKNEDPEKHGSVETAEAYFENEVIDEVIVEDGDQYNHALLVEADLTEWKEEETLEMLKEEEDSEKHGSVETSEAHYQTEVIEEVIIEDEDSFDHALLVETDLTTWTEKEIEGVLDDEEMEKSRYANVAEEHCDDEFVEELRTEDQSVTMTKISTEHESLDEVNEEKTSFRVEEDSGYMTRDTEEGETRYPHVTEPHLDNKLKEYDDEEIGEENLEDESLHFDQLVVATKVETEGEGSEGEWTDVISYRQQETTDTQKGEEISVQPYLNPESVVGDSYDSTAHDEVTDDGTAQEDTNYDYETTYILESSDHGAVQIDRSSEAEYSQTFEDRPKEMSSFEQGSGEHQTIRNPESTIDYESRSKDLSERIWKMLEGQGLGRRDVPNTDSKRNEYLESMSQSLSEKRWKEIEQLRKASDEALAKAQGSTKNISEKGFDFETWHRSFSERKLQAINSTKKPSYLDVDVETMNFGEGHSRIISEIATTDSSEKERYREEPVEEEFESFDTGLHEEGWRTITLKGEQNSQTISEIGTTDSSEKEMHPEEPVEEEFESFDTGLHEEGWRNITLKGEQNSQTISEVATTDSPEKDQHPEELVEDEFESFDTGLHEEGWRNITLKGEHNSQIISEAETKERYPKEPVEEEFESFDTGLHEEGWRTITLKGEQKSQTISEVATTDSSEKEMHPEEPAEEEFESFDTGLHEEGWRTITLKEEQNSQNISEIATTDSSEKEKHPEETVEEEFESFDTGLHEEGWRTITSKGEQNSQTISEIATTDSSEKEKHPEEPVEDEFESFDTGLHEVGWRTTTLKGEQNSQTISETEKNDSSEKEKHPEVPVEDEFESFDTGLREEGWRTITLKGEQNSQTISEIAATDSSEKQMHPEEPAEEEFESFDTGLHEEGWRTITLNEQSSSNTNSSEIDPTSQPNGADGGKSDSDYMVTYEYGEMYSVFHHIPFSIEMLRESVMENFNSSPTMRRLLSRYPSLRPGTWKWSSTLRERPSLQRPWEIAAEPDTRIREVQHLETVSVADQFTPHLMTEKFDIV